MSLTREVHCPEDVLASIAWYPEGLDEERRGAVEAHAADCVACREEIAFVHGEAAPPEPLQSDAQRVYARVLERIDSYERDADAEPGSWHAPGAAPVAPLRRAARPPAVRAAAALVAAAFVGAFAAYTAARFSAPPDAVYRTASESGIAGASAPAVARGLDVVFRPDATAERIQAALRAIGGEIVSGPTQLGVYRVRLAPTADVSAAATVLRGDGQGVATFAEPAPH